jgi:hypothetical protein
VFWLGLPRLEALTVVDSTVFGIDEFEPVAIVGFELSLFIGVIPFEELTTA